jgi:hypothetical protein
MAKRGLNKVQDPYTLQDMYIQYIKEFDESSPYHITYIEYRDITTLFLKYLADQMILKSATVTLPFRLGDMSVVKRKPAYKSLRNMVIDWVTTRALHKHVYQFNSHSNGFLYQFYWDRGKCNVPYKIQYVFKPTRQNKRLVAKLVKDRTNDYFERT